jgi:hypothetical protein
VLHSVSGQTVNSSVKNHPRGRDEAHLWHPNICLMEKRGLSVRVPLRSVHNLLKEYGSIGEFKSLRNSI